MRLLPFAAAADEAAWFADPGAIVGSATRSYEQSSAVPANNLKFLAYSYRHRQGRSMSGGISEIRLTDV